MNIQISPRRLTATTIGLLLLPVLGDTFTPLVDMVAAGAENWSWGGARIQETSQGLMVREHNREGGYGDVYFSTRLPLLSQGQVEVKASPKQGGYTLQMIGFEGDQSVYMREPVKSETDDIIHRISLADLDIPEGTDSLLFKFWVVDAENASSQIEVLRYGILTPGDQPPLQGQWNNSEGWQLENAEITTIENGIIASAGTKENIAALVWTEMLPRIDGSWLVHLPEVKNTTVKLTLPAFDKDGTYLRSVSTPNALESGWNIIDLTQLEWPDEAKSFQPKFWIENATGAVTFGKWILVP